MNKRMIGLIAVVGSALGAWWWTSQRRTRGPHVQMTSKREHGRVVFHNTPTPSDVDAII
jgi:hypothetical protein